MKNLILILLIVLFFGACKKLHDGVVVKKHIEPERYYTFRQPIPIRTGKITTIIFVSHRMYDDEDYVITIDGFVDGPGSEERIEDFYVSKIKYECIREGDHFFIDSLCSNEANSDKRLN